MLDKIKKSDIIKTTKEKEREVTIMRLVNYEVKQADGTVFQTTNYKEATEGGNRIESIYLTPHNLDIVSEAQEQERLDHIAKVDAYMAKKRV